MGFLLHCSAVRAEDGGFTVSFLPRWWAHFCVASIPICPVFLWDSASGCTGKYWSCPVLRGTPQTLKRLFPCEPGRELLVKYCWFCLLRLEVLYTKSACSPFILWQSADKLPLPMRSFNSHHAPLRLFIQSSYLYYEISVVCVSVCVFCKVHDHCYLSDILHTSHFNNMDILCCQIHMVWVLMQLVPSVSDSVLLEDQLLSALLYV